MRLLLVVISSILIASCGKHDQQSTSSDGVKNTVQVEAAEVLVQKILNDDVSYIENYISNNGNINHEFVSTGRTLITEACSWSKLRIIDLLVKKGADITLKDRNGKSAEDYGVENIKIRRIIYPHIMILLKKNVYISVKNNNLTELKKQLEENPPLNFFINVADFGQDAESFEGETLLTLLLKLKFENTLRLLAQPKYELDVNLKNKKNETPLEIARKLNLKNAEKLLLKLGAINE